MFSVLAALEDAEEIPAELEVSVEAMNLARPNSVPDGGSKDGKSPNRPATATGTGKPLIDEAALEGVKPELGFFPVCHQYLRSGQCRGGDRCRFSHVNPTTYKEHLDSLHKRGPAPPAQVKSMWYPPIPAMAAQAAAQAHPMRGHYGKMGHKSKGTPRAGAGWNATYAANHPAQHAAANPNGPHAAGIVVARDGKDRLEFLLVKHVRGGHWCPPKGNLESDGEPLAAACGKVNDETGIAPNYYTVLENFTHTQEYPLPHPTRRIPSGRKIVLHYAAKLNKENNDVTVRLTPEHDDHAWLCLEKACERVEHNETQELLKAASDAFLGVKKE